MWCNKIIIKQFFYKWLLSWCGMHYNKQFIGGCLQNNVIIEKQSVVWWSDIFICKRFQVNITGCYKRLPKQMRSMCVKKSQYLENN